MFIFVGLGNPTREYENSRHNAGFGAIDALAAKYGISVNEKKHKALVGKGIIDGQKVLLVKPQTYMNLSGESLREVMDFYKIDPTEELIVLFDDISLEPGNLRIRKKGSAGGHNGIKSIIQHLGTQDFARVKIGVGAKPERMDLAAHVLGHFSEEDRKLMEQAYQDAAAAAVLMMNGETEQAMNLYNAKKKKKEEQPEG